MKGSNENPITDYQLLNFLQALLGSDLILDEWETRFTASFRASSRPSLWFTFGRRASTIKMWMKYGALLNHPFPTDEVKPAGLPRAEADACEYFVKDENRQMARCNAPATRENRAGFRYCAEHADLAQKEVTRRGGKMELRAFRPGTK